MAQSIYVSSNQLLTLTDDAVLYTSSAVINEGVIFNEGTIQLDGNWSNQQSYSGNGWLRLTGSSDQTVQHNNQVVGSLEANGGGAKIVEGSLSVNDTLSLINGHVIAIAQNVIQLNENVQVENANDNSYIQGTVRFRGTGYHYLPIGTSTAFLPITLEDVTGVSPLVEVVAFSDQQLEVAGEALETKVVSNYWTITSLEGRYDGSVVTLTATLSDNFDDIIGAVVVESDNLDGSFNNLGQRNREGDRTSGLITSEAIANKSIVALGLTAEYVLENSVEIPSAFSPIASDATDRSVRVYSASLQSEGFLFTIFNRWGQVVYQTSDLQSALTSGWGGLDTNTRQPLPSGVYPYVLRGIYDSGQAVEKTGSITLFR
ncbi:gliding motility-associated C-terminal domain-containing protein [Tunicatimonas pelagia]|uniref:T9SS type B sorting domain-containing protein n=1 Tax=Tunicatimonas pelagia TaxID=931531 RepID=UPI0026657C9D|nr:gliding motility-associated C-terminal domain-containing protein [Tunicatimonas pelagia]WKN42502.1 gliding motility-associated C-terminal domain-containing protein [Tunicatimonas pelagia]